MTPGRDEALVGAELLEEVLHQERDVLLALAQRRQLHRDDVQPVEQILAEQPVRHHASEVVVGRGDDAHIDLGRMRIAHALELALLQDPQQLHLQPRAHRADLVEKERALVRLFEPSQPVGDGARERAADMAEQLGLEQRLGDRAAVERHEPVHPARAVVVDGARDDFLSRSGLTGDEERAVRGRDGLQQLKQVSHRAALADDPFEPIALLELRAQVGILGPQPPLLERRIEHVEQFVDLKRLADEIPRAALDGFDGVFQGAVSGDDDGDDVGIAADGGLDDGGAVDARQPQVGDDDVVGEIGESGDGGLARSRPGRPRSRGRRVVRRWPLAARLRLRSSSRCFEISVI